jgi:uncharacterized membrane protein
VRSCSLTVMVVGEEIITYSESVLVALVILHAMGMCHIVIYGLSGSTIFFFFTFYHKMHDFRNKIHWTKKVLIFSTTFV